MIGLGNIEAPEVPAWPSRQTLRLPLSANRVGSYTPERGITTWITQERADGSYQPVAWLSGVGTSCVATAGYVICTTARKRVSLWRLPLAGS